MAKPEHTSAPEDQLALYELLHGSSLAYRHLQEVLKPGREKAGDEPRPDLFKKYPEIGEAARMAEEALSHLYTIVGQHFKYDLSSKSLPKSRKKS